MPGIRACGNCHNLALHRHQATLSSGPYDVLDLDISSPGHPTDPLTGAKADAITDNAVEELSGLTRQRCGSDEDADLNVPVLGSFAEVRRRNEHLPLVDYDALGVQRNRGVGRCRE